MGSLGENFQWVSPWVHDRIRGMGLHGYVHKGHPWASDGYMKSVFFFDVTSAVSMFSVQQSEIHFFWFVGQKRKAVR